MKCTHESQDALAETGVLARAEGTTGATTDRSASPRTGVRLLGAKVASGGSFPSQVNELKIDMKVFASELLMAMMELPQGLTIEEKHKLEDEYDCRFPHCAGKITPFIRWLYPEQPWVQRANPQ